MVLQARGGLVLRLPAVQEAGGAARWHTLPAVLGAKVDWARGRELPGPGWAREGTLHSGLCTAFPYGGVRPAEADLEEWHLVPVEHLQRPLVGLPIGAPARAADNALRWGSMLELLRAAGCSTPTFSLEGLVRGARPVLLSAVEGWSEPVEEWAEAPAL
jgi:hypothetical protein